MLAFLYILLLIVVVIGLFILGKKIPWLSSTKIFVVLLIILIVTGFLFFKIVYKVNSKPNFTTKPNNEISKNNNLNLDYDKYKNKTTIIIGTTANFMPWNYKESNSITGYNISVLKRAIKLMGKDVQIKVYPTEENLYSALDNKEIDIIADLKPIEKTISKYNYSLKLVDPPYVFIVKESNVNKNIINNNDINVLESFLSNKIISTLENNFLINYLNNGSFNFTKLKILDKKLDVIKSVEKGNTFAGFVEYFSFLSYKRLNPKTQLVVLNPMISNVATNGYAFVMNSSDIEIKKQLDIALNVLKRRGELVNLSINYFKEDVTL